MESREANGSTGQLSSGGSIGGGYASSTGMHHSHSTPAGVDGVGGGGAGGGGSRTPPATPKKGGKMLAIRVQMLDDTITIFQVQAKALGQVLFDQVCKQLHLLEADYFGLEYTDLSQTRYWLDLQKPMSRQLGLSLVDPLLQFCVKFYTPDPGQLEEEYTRYLYCLQVKRDLAVGLMHCNDNTAALMASYIVQAECGDYVAEDYPDHTYLSSYKFVPHQDPEMERRIMENHKKHAGQSPAEADLNLLETARRCELYGIKLHPAKDHENVPLNLAVAHMGIVVYQQITKINTFSWAKIRKLSFKRKKFLIKLHPEGYGYYKDTVEFFFEGRDECKNFWKKCVENHGFFRCSTVQYVSRHKTRVLSRGSSFRYSGKTQKQMVEFVRDNYVKRQTFQRSASFRHSSAHLNANNKNTSSVGNSISAHPLLPLADSNLSEDEGNANITIVPSAPSPESTDNNNSFYASTPMSKTSSVTSNGFSDALNVTNGSYILSPMDNDLASPMASRAKNESYMNNRNINGNSNGNGINNNANIANINANTTTIVAEIEGEVKKRVPRCDKIYYIAKEILCTEITYQKDLEVINTCFRREFEQEGFEECSILLGLVAPLAHAHALLVSDLEQRMSNWDVQGGVKNNTGKIADVLLVHLPPLLTVYEEYLDGHLLVLERLDQASKQNSRFEHLYREFETQKVCYLPLSAFVLKPLHRLLHYQSLLQRLLKNYTPNHPDINDCMTVNDSLKDLIQPVLDTLAISENIATLCELQRDVCGYDSIVQNGRKFVRHGCLLKHSSKKGYQQRMFFLFSDILLYTSRSAATQFKVHGHMPLRGVLIEEPDGELANYGLIIYGGNRALTVAANSQEEKERWKADLHQAIKQARDKTDAKVTYLSLKSSSSSDEIIEQCGNEPPKAPLQRNNTTVHVCWHRNTSISMKDQLIAVENQLSGYLLRKFKSSNGWQKLWVVFTSFCLFFYKRSTDDFPLASLPLLCYTVGAPTVEDAISKDFVFKLQYKNHVYFFRAESEYTYQRWLEVISSATQQGTIKRRHIDNIANQNSIETSPEK